MTGDSTVDPSSFAELRRLLSADFARVLRQTTGGKPTSRLRRMMHLTLPAMQVAIFHRTAHCLYGRGWRRCAALVSDLSLRLTGASLHPGSPIGAGLFVPHPARVVFCGSAGIDLILLPGTMVSPRDWVFPGQPFPADAPCLGDGTVVGAHAAVQGAVTVGAGATIGIGVCTVRDVPAGTVTMLAQRQIRTRESAHDDVHTPEPIAGRGRTHAPLPPPSAGEGGPRSGSGEGNAVSGEDATIATSASVALPLSRPLLTQGPPSLSAYRIHTSPDVARVPSPVREGGRVAAFASRCVNIVAPARGVSAIAVASGGEDAV